MARKTKEQVFYLSLWSLLLCTLVKVALASAIQDWVCGWRYVGPVEGSILIELKKIKI